jgi:hypothetical protein
MPECLTLSINCCKGMPCCRPGSIENIHFTIIDRQSSDRPRLVDLLAGAKAGKFAALHRRKVLPHDSLRRRPIAELLPQVARQSLKLLQAERAQLLLLADGHAGEALEHLDRLDPDSRLVFDLAFAEFGGAFPFSISNRSFSCIVHGFVLSDFCDPGQR